MQAEQWKNPRPKVVIRKEEEDAEEEEEELLMMSSPPKVESLGEVLRQQQRVLRIAQDQVRIAGTQSCHLKFSPKLCGWET